MAVNLGEDVSFSEDGVCFVVLDDEFFFDALEGKNFFGFFVLDHEDGTERAMT